jgi:hypothetical protein
MVRSVLSSTWGLSVMANLWDVPKPTLQNGEHDDKLLFEEIGRALTEWSKVEALCAELFATLLSSRLKKSLFGPPIRAWGAVIGFGARCEMLREAGEAYFHRRKKKRAELEGRFKALIQECFGFAARRNDIAHGEVVRVETTKRGKTIHKGYLLLPPFHNPKKYGLDEMTAYAYASSQIIYFRQEFTKLQLRIAGMIQSLHGDPWPRPLPDKRRRQPTQPPPAKPYRT